MANPNPKTLLYLDNANRVPAPYGVNVPFNDEPQDIWLGYDVASNQLCITNYNRTTVIGCYSGSGGGGQLFGMHNDNLGIQIETDQINNGNAFLPIQPCLLPVVTPDEATSPGISGANYLLNNGVGGKFERLMVRVTSNQFDQDIMIVLRKNGADTLVKVIIPALATGDFFDNVNSIVGSGGADEFCLEARPVLNPVGADEVMAINQYQLWLRPV